VSFPEKQMLELGFEGIIGVHQRREEGFLLHRRNSISKGPEAG
jgi:hypothetical protein